MAVKELYKTEAIQLQKDITTKTGYGETVISNYLSGRVAPSKNFIKKFSEVFNLDPTTLTLKSPNAAVVAGSAPYLSDIDVVAGKHDISDTDISEYKTGLISIPDFKNVTCYVNVSGSSQYPKYIAGDIIALRQIFDFTELHYGSMYVVVTPENRVLKMVRRAKNEKQNILLLSENPKYDPYEIPRNKIRAMFLVLGKITKESL